MPKANTTVSNVVLLDSDSDEDIAGIVGGGGGGGEAFRISSSLMENQQVPAPISDATVASRETLECRSFWKAGDNFEIQKCVTPAASGMLEHARIHPKFLHSNATSHKWAFGAIAEIIDNAVDEIQNGATFVKIDKIDIVKDNSPALVFKDDGGGMDPDGIRKCMSLGYSSKKSNTTIGQYGNGFKTSTMRLGADAIVFSRSTRGGKSTQSVGLLSYTFLRRTGQDDVIVPMIDIDISNQRPQPIIYGSSEDWSANLNILLKWSPFSTEGELLQQFEDIGTHGTKVILYNLWLNDEGIYELSFDEDDEDIRLRDENSDNGKRVGPITLELRAHISYRYRHSLKDYISMLYLKKLKNFKIILRGIHVEQFNIADEFKYPETRMYKPHAATMEYVATEIKVGFVKEAPKLPISGFNVYHKNRLIMPFWKVTLGGSSRGNGVVGVLEANFIEPAHDKQEFERSSLFLRLEARLKKITQEYWASRCEVVGYHPHTPSYKSRRVPIPEQSPPTNIGNTFNTSSLPCDKISQSGPIIREINLSKGTSSYKAVVAPPHMRNFTGLRSNFQPVQLIPPPAATNTGNNVSGRAADEISEENIKLFMKCEEYIKKENEMEQTVKNLEKELEEAKSKRAQLALLLDAKRKEMQQV